MSDAARAILTAVQAMNTLMTLRRELQVGYDELARVMEKADREGRNLSVEDLRDLRADSDAARESLERAIQAARQGN